MQTAHFWLWGWGGDRVYLQRVLQALGDQVFTGTGRYTVNYRLGGNDGSVKEEFFVQGNARILQRYASAPQLPWAVE